MEDVAAASSWTVTERSMTAEVRRAAVELAGRLGLDETLSAGIGIAATEACTNLLKHAGGGTVLLGRGRSGGLDLLALDKGPGMRDVAACLSDGYSSTATSGTGLGAIRRLSSSFDIYSAPQKGTVLCASFGGSELSGGVFDIAAIRTARPGETVCGDDCSWRDRDGQYLFVVADGLGHGPLAATASRDAIDVFRSSGSDEPSVLLHDIHAALRSTRGAAVAITRIDLARSLVVFAGLGNIAAAIVTPSVVRHMVSHNGTAGHQAQKIADFTYPWAQGSILVMCSDGLSTHWSLQQYPGLLRHSSQSIAAVLYRDYRRGRDDAAVVVARISEEPRSREAP